MKLVRVVWYDVYSDSLWYCKEDIMSSESIRCVSVGFLIEENEREVKLCHTVSDVDLVMGKLIIPKGMIRKMEEIGDNESILQE